MNKEHWIEKKWRPMMGWMYMVICILDFAVFPVFWSILQAYYEGSVTTAWDPLTLKGAGLFHMAMGAIIGVTAWSRGQEKIAGVSNITPPILNSGPESNNTGTVQVTTTVGGKKVVPQSDQPIL